MQAPEGANKVRGTVTGAGSQNSRPAPFGNQFHAHHAMHPPCHAPCHAPCTTYVEDIKYTLAQIKNLHVLLYAPRSRLVECDKT